MKTLKRSLCLVLALVMVVGLLAVGASAANITDSNDIQYEVPVGVMNGMGIIEGYPDGTFLPAKTVNRAEAAKMICFALLGKSAAEGLVATAAPFADVAVGDWYAPYVSYLKTKGIVDGYDDGLYHGGNPVTGLQLAKMLLTAVGYGKAAEYTGEGFLTNTYVDALSLGESKSIFNGTKATDLTAAATREEAALYIYNAMCYFIQVKYVPGNVLLGTAPYYDKGTNKTMADARYGYVPTTTFVTGMITGYTKSAGKTYVTLNNVPTTNIYTPELAQYGHTYKLYYGTDNVVYYAEQLSTAYTVPSTVTTAQKLYNALGSVVTWVSTADIPEFTNYVYTVAVTNYDPSLTATTVSDADVVALSGKTIMVYNNVITVIINNPTVTLNKVSSISTVLGSENINLSTIGSLDNTAVSDKVVEYAGIAKDDVVLATSLGGGVYSLTKVTPITGMYTAKAVPSSGATTYTIGGVAYTASAVVNNTGLTLAAPNAMVPGTEYKIYLDATGKLIGGIGASAVVTNYAYVAQFGQTTTTDFYGIPQPTLVADIYFADGTHAVYPIDVTTAATAFTGATYGSGTATATTVNGIGLYDVKIAANGKAVIKAVTDTAIVAGAAGDNTVNLSEITVKKGVAKIGADTAGKVLYADANSFVFHVTGTYGVTTGASAYKVTVLTGIANFQTSAALTQAFKKTTAGIDILTAAVSGTAITPTVPANVVYFNGKYVDQTSIVDGAAVTMRTYTVYTNGVASTVSYKAGAITAAGFYTTGAADLVTYATNVKSNVATASYFGGYLTLADGTDLVVTADTAIVDLTTAKEYTALVVSGNTIKIYAEYTVANSINTAKTIYVTDITTP